MNKIFRIKAPNIKKQITKLVRLDKFKISMIKTCPYG